MVSKTPSKSISNGFTAKYTQIVLADRIITVDPTLDVNHKAWEVYSPETLFQSIMPGNWARLIFNGKLPLKGSHGKVHDRWLHGERSDGYAFTTKHAIPSLLSEFSSDVFSS